MDKIDTAKFWSRVTIESDFQCWTWNGAKSEKGYGRWQAGDRTVMAHRHAYELVTGPIPDGLMLRHSCDNPACVNPRHLDTGTARDNAQDAIARGRWTRGDRNGKAKLSPRDVLEIRTNPNREKLRALASRFGVSPATVSLIRSGKRWADVGSELSRLSDERLANRDGQDGV